MGRQLDHSWTTAGIGSVCGSAPPWPSQLGGPGAGAPSSMAPAARRTWWTRHGVTPTLQLTSPTSLLHLQLQPPDCAQTARGHAPPASVWAVLVNF